MGVNTPDTYIPHILKPQNSENIVVILCFEIETVCINFGCPDTLQPLTPPTLYRWHASGLWDMHVKKTVNIKF